MVSSSRNELRWLRGLIEHLEQLGRTEELGNARLRLHISQAEINDMQGRDRNSGVVSRRCNRLRANGVLEPGTPLVVRLDQLPNTALFRVVTSDGPTSERSPLLGSAAHATRAGSGTGQPDVDADQEAVNGAAEFAVPGCDTPALAVALAQALQLCCADRRWDLADRITTLLEQAARQPATAQPIPVADSHLRAVSGALTQVPACPSPDMSSDGLTHERTNRSVSSARFPKIRAANQHGPRDPRGSLDDDVSTSSSVPLNPREQRSQSRGTTSDQGARVMQQRAEPLKRAEPGHLRTNDLAPSAGPALAHGWDDLVVDAPDDVTTHASAVVAVDSAHAGEISVRQTQDELLLNAVEPLRVVCRRHGLPDLENLEVLRSAYPEHMFERLAGDVSQLIDKISAGTRVHNPFGLLVASARQTPLPDPANDTIDLTGGQIEGVEPHAHPFRPASPVRTAEELLERQRALTGWDDIDSPTPSAAQPPDRSFVQGRLTELKARLRDVSSPADQHATGRPVTP